MPDICKKIETKITPDYIGHRQRLRERFLADDGKTMPDYELLELILTFALPRRDVKPLAKALLRRFAHLADVFAASAKDLQQVIGVGETVVALLKVIQASSNKICWGRLEDETAPVLTSHSKIIDYCRSCIGHAPQETLLLIFLDARGKVIAQNIEQVGTVDAVMISTRQIAERALGYKAVSVIMAHNHPSGNCQPSQEDVNITTKVKQALRVMEMQLIDHLIITSGGYYSMREQPDWLLT